MKTVLFICEHGSAKSVVAAAHFNSLATQRGVDVRAISRGTDPDTSNHPAALAGLEADGLQPDSLQPRQLAQAELESAARVISFNELPSHYAMPSDTVTWRVPPVSENYQTSRQAIVERIELLLADFAERK